MTDRHIEKAGTRRLTEPSLDHPGRSGFRGLMTEVQRDSYRRLGWIAGVLALMVAAVFVVFLSVRMRIHTVT